MNIMKELIILSTVINSSKSNADIAKALNKQGFTFLVYGHDYVNNGHYVSVDSYTAEESIDDRSLALIYCDENRGDFYYTQEVSEDDIDALRYLHSNNELKVFINNEWINI